MSKLKGLSITGSRSPCLDCAVGFLGGRGSMGWEDSYNELNYKKQALQQEGA